MLLAIAGAVVLAILLAALLHIGTATIIIVPAVFAAVRWYLLSDTALMVDQSGVQVGDVGVPWSSIAHVTVYEPAHRVVNATRWVSVQLRPDAPVPAGEAQPGQPGAANVRQVHGQVRAGKLDPNRLVAKVRQLAPHVQVAVRRAEHGGGVAVPPAGRP